MKLLTSNILSLLPFLLAPDHPDIYNKNGEPYSVRRFVYNWLFIIGSMGLLSYVITQHSIAMTILMMMVLPCLAVYQGAAGMLYYRYHFGTPPHPQNPAHGVVVVNPEDLPNKKCSSTKIQYGTYHQNHLFGGGCQCEGGLRWRRGGPLNKKEQRVLDNALKEEPIRILLMGDSLALGLGSDRSCTSLLPETLAKSISKKMGGRAVFWTVYGGEGAATSWTLQQLQSKNKKISVSESVKAISSTLNIKKKPLSFSSSSSPPSLTSLSEMSPLTPTGSFDIDEEESDEKIINDSLIGRIVVKEEKSKTKVLKKNGDNKEKKLLPRLFNYSSITQSKKKIKKKTTTTVDIFGEWKQKLYEFRQGFENDKAGPYDYVFILSGGNDAKAAFIPCYGRTKKGDSGNEKKSLYKDFESILECLGPKMYNTNLMETDDNDEEDDDNVFVKTKDASSTKKKPYVVFPMMPSRLIPSFQLYPLLWLAIPLIGIIENTKRSLGKKYSNHVLTIDAPSNLEATFYENQEGLLWKRRMTEDTLLCLRDVTAQQCVKTTTAMKQHVTKKSSIYKNYASIFKARNQKKTDDNSCMMVNAPQPKLSTLKGGGKGYGIVSVDRVHPNDEGYDFWARSIAEGFFQQLEGNL